MKQLTAKIGSKKTLTVTYATPQETLLGTPLTLPTSEPATPQVSYTIASDDLPVFSITPYSVAYIAALYGAGRFATAGTLYWRIKKNGSSVATGSQAVAANTYYTITAPVFGVVAGDVVEVAFWSNQTDSTYDYKALSVQYSRFLTTPKTSLHLNIHFEKVDTNLSLSLGTPSAADTWIAGYQSISANNYNSTSDYSTGWTFTMPVRFYGAFSSSTYGIVKSYMGDPGNTGTVKTHASYRPYYVPYRKVERFSWRQVRF